MKINKNTYGARGCGKEATYIMLDCSVGQFASMCKAVLDSPVASSEE